MKYTAFRSMELVAEEMRTSYGEAKCQKYFSFSHNNCEENKPTIYFGALVE